MKVKTLSLIHIFPGEIDINEQIALARELEAMGIDLIPVSYTHLNDKSGTFTP